MNPFSNYIEALRGAHIEEQFSKFKDSFENDTKIDRNSASLIQNDMEIE